MIIYAFGASLSIPPLSEQTCVHSHCRFLHKLIREKWTSVAAYEKIMHFGLHSVCLSVCLHLCHYPNSSVYLPLSLDIIFYLSICHSSFLSQSLGLLISMLLYPFCSSMSFPFTFVSFPFSSILVCVCLLQHRCFLILFIRVMWRAFTGGLF